MGKRVLITGGSGFLGRRVATLLSAEFEPYLGARNHEANASAREATGCPALPLDVSSIESVRDVVAEIRPHVIVHAAATKHVAQCELMPMECIDVNVRGSQNVARVAIERGVETVVGISSDKAAAPQGGAYALSKALMERSFCALDAKSDTRFACVRLGNIAWSTGSVLPEWRAMAAAHDGVITSTGPDMSRFFMTVDDAAQTVRAAIANRELVRGAVLARQMRAARIRDLLSVWTDVFGGRWVAGARRLGDRDVEWLVGDAEASFARDCTVDGVPSYLIAPARPVAEPLVRGVVSSRASQLGRAEMEALLRVRRDAR